ncbi:uncharacterized protein shps [Epargyreus clarus]|uniref:uncharacterized protein shps n=1 Tax=Epargyreus clarus TaxID=520877 RepID=UPI003C2F7C05
MVAKTKSGWEERSHKNIKADIIVLGCSLPGIVTAHKLNKKFGDTINIVVLDLAGNQKVNGASQRNVGFQEDEQADTETYSFDGTARQLIDNVARHYLAMFAKDFKISLPETIIIPRNVTAPFSKIFEYSNGTTVPCPNDYHDFDYLNFLERFELNQYQTLLDENMKDLFQTNKVDAASERLKLLYYDKTTMEQHICEALLFPNSRQIMRTMVRLVCGVPPNTVSVLFYLHQCYRTSSAKNHLGGCNTRFREKLLGYCRKHLANKLQQSIAKITLSAKSIKEIRSYSNKQVILTTMKGETNYICNLLAMALKPDELEDIEVEANLLSEKEAAIAKAMKQGKAKKFMVQYEESFWKEQGYSGDIFSMRGPILWAMQRPKLSTTGDSEHFPSLVGYLMIKNDKEEDSKEAVIRQLVKLFGQEAANPLSYKEANIADVFVPRCGDYVALRKLTNGACPQNLEWGALDIFADGDVAAALEAGNTAYLHLMSCLRPQAQSYEEVVSGEWPTFLNETPYTKWFAKFNIVKTMHVIACTAAIYVGIRVMQSMRRN